MTITTKVSGPILLPNTPDCDYPNGEELLSAEKIDQLKQSFKDYGIIDYQHKFTDDKDSYFLENVGTPVRLVTLTDDLTFKDVTGENITVPSGTLWLESHITNPTVEKEIMDKEIVAYSVTISEKGDADEVINVYKQLRSNHANKQDQHGTLHEIHERLANKRTLIKDIKDPVMLTVSVVKFPCVNKAKFCSQSIQTLEQEEDNSMSDKADNTQTKEDINSNFIESIKTAVNEFRNSSKEEEEQEEPVTGTDGAVTMEVVDTKIEAMKSELNEKIDSNQAELLGAIKSLTAPKLTDEEKEIVDDGTGDDGITPPVQSEADETEPVEDKDDDGKEGDGKDDEPDPKETKTKTKSKTGKGGKARKEKPIKEATPSAQKSRINAQLNGETKKMTTKRDEFSVIYDAIKNGMSTKGLSSDEISYEATGLVPYNRKYLDFIEDPIMINAYKANLTFNDEFTISEADTRKAILNTNLFATYVQKIILEEPLLQDAQYQTGIHGKGHIYDIDDTIGTEDGALPEHYYFDKNVVEQQATIGDREIETYPQRTKINISDRQRLANVYGDDLVNILLDRTIRRLRQGVAAARFYGNKSGANSIDLQYRRQDGYLKEAGVQLTSNDVNLDKITDIFDTMFYSLPEEAQTESEYVFYVPTNVRRAFGSYFLDKAADRAIDFIGQKTPLYWGDAEIKVSPTLNNKPVRDLLDDGNVSVLLTKPSNTHFIVGREAGIEPKRYAETSSNTYYATIDSANAYTFNDYAVRLSLTADEYAGLVGNSGDDQP